MTTKTLDSNISDILQSNSAVEYVEPRENPIALREKDIGQKTDPQDSVKQDAIRLFKNDLGFNVRVVMRDDEPWFVAKDVAACIEYKDTSTMVRLCREKDIYVTSASDFDSADLAESGNSRITLISESGLYRILAKCNLPKCEPFESWVFDEVLPSIRKTGNYSIMQTQPTIYDYARALIAEKERSDALKAQNKALQAERDDAIHAESLAKEASDQSFKARATAMGRLSNIRFRESDVRASERMAAYGHPSRNKKFTVQNVMEAAWFQMMFKASQSERFYNGNPAWKPLIKSLKRLLSLKANNVVRHELENRFHEELSSTKAKKVFSLWMKAKEGGTPFHESLVEIDLGDMAVRLGGYIDEMVCLSERYSYTRSNGDTAYGIVYGYAYDIWARVLSSLYVREMEDYLRDNVEPDDFENTLYSVRSECYGLI